MKIKMISSVSCNGLSYNYGQTFTVGKDIDKIVSDDFIKANFAVELKEEVKKPKVEKVKKVEAEEIKAEEIKVEEVVEKPKRQGRKRVI